MGQSSQSFDQLRKKYQSVLNLMQQLQVQVQHVNMDGSKLFISGVAPSMTVKNRIWDQIKLVDPNYAADLICDINISQQAPAEQGGATMTAGASISGGQNQRRYTVQPGDTLSKISRQFYGDANQYTRIFNANRNLLPDANTIRPGQELVIPE
jgi:nucleoid-associated protein YgaU